MKMEQEQKKEARAAERIREIEDERRRKESVIMQNMKRGAIASYIMSGIFLILGFHKMFSYDSGELVNAYVGGDAYNYIINANYATGYFTLAVFCAVIGMTFVLSYLTVGNRVANEG